MKIVNSYTVKWMTVEHGAVQKQFGSKVKAKKFQREVNKKGYAATCTHYVTTDRYGFNEQVSATYI